MRLIKNRECRSPADVSLRIRRKKWPDRSSLGSRGGFRRQRRVAGTWRATAAHIRLYEPPSLIESSPQSFVRIP